MVTLCYHGFPCQKNKHKCVTVVRGTDPFLTNQVCASEQGLVFRVLNVNVYYFTISSRPSDKGGRGVGGGLQKVLFSALWSSVWHPRASPLDPPLHLVP